MTPTESEQEDKVRLHKATEHLDYCRTKENDARRTLAECVQDTKRAKEKHEALFAECEARACARRKAGLIAVNPGY